MRPTIFIASSSQDKALIDAMAARLQLHADVKPWTEEGFSQLGQDILEWIRTQARNCEFGLFLLSPDSRWGGQPNGNVLLELGLFIGALGPQRSFILKPADLPVPADLQGRILAQYDREAFLRDGPQALDDACHAIAAALQRHAGDFVAQLRGLWLETKTIGQAEDPHSLLLFDAVADQPSVRGRSYNAKGEPLAKWPDQLDTYWVHSDQRMLYHMFDARVGRFSKGRALGVTFFEFDAGMQRGEGYYVVHGGGEIELGAVEFTLRRVTLSWLQSLGLDPVVFRFEDTAACKELIRQLNTA